ncbi:MAG: protein of unknown function with transrane region [Candidatus Nomurabacteria bacterium]|nr:protein of unknown function with transrane region [Candidatus Nomurabacteria bacterium]
MYDNTVVETAAQSNAFDSAISFGQRVTAGLFSTTLLGVIYVVLTLLTIGLITLILFLFVRMYELRREAELKKKPVITPSAMPTATAGSTDNPLPVENPTWKHIRERLLGDNPSDWKLAVIEADIYMDRCLDDNGFHGDTTGDKLKQVTPDRLPSVQIAWEVHKIRNRIAHDGAAFVLTMPEARRLLSYYEIIFTDLHAI